MPADSPRIRALTWNVHGFVGRRGRRDPAAVCNAVRQLDPDIVALQEIEERGRGPDEMPAFRHLRDALSHHGAEARTVCSVDGDYGHVLMTRWPIRGQCCLDLSFRRREPRMAISVSIAAPGGPIRVLAAHLGLSGRERRYQIGIIRRHLDEAEEDSVIVMGDFNDWRRVGSAARALCPPFTAVAEQASFPAYYPVLPLDRIWCRGALRPVTAGVADAFGHLSDHLPVFADLGRTAGNSD